MADGALSVVAVGSTVVVAEVVGLTAETAVPVMLPAVVLRAAITAALATIDAVVKFWGTVVVGAVVAGAFVEVAHICAHDLDA